jgi:hypothetical protein
MTPNQQYVPVENGPEAQAQLVGPIITITPLRTAEGESTDTKPEGYSAATPPADGAPTPEQSDIQ